MIITPAAIPRVPRQSAQDVRIVVTFTPADPIGATDVEIVGGETPSVWRTYQLVDDAAQRLAVYAHDFRHAAEGDTEVRG